MPLKRPNHHLIDVLKIVAAQCVVWHHLARYGPLSDDLNQTAPELSRWLFDYANMAVQVFLVVAGYLAARSLANRPRAEAALLPTLWRRYERLILPFLLALVLTVLVSAIARPYLDGDLVPGVPSMAQWLAHASLLHSVLGLESMSAGAWYVAIDFQLYALLALLFWLARGRAWASVLLVAAMAVASLTWFNLDVDFDNWALYFFGAYGMGALSWWAGLRSNGSRFARVLYATTLLVGLASLALAFRERIALALSVSSVLLAFGNRQLPLPRHLGQWVRRLGNSSYALFLVHFSVLLLANALWSELDLEDSDWALFFALAVWSLSLLASLAFHAQVEQRIARWRAAPVAGAGVTAK
ncbi:GTP cyclohydrolase [Rhodoferax lacus]|uniref:GTP cyclohydrolase n=1 Tax=Rhodoferax lacus TaxID=2184758 RepID=A0A3E1RAV6_9BURK|nr:acyltransferase family protein [Rhodoferax lacus]RFO96182.1 GTP cyclohydrolase [Rhodoferax lacus]